ncbi:MAG: hypothetical protein GSR86_02430, partial [Desulfurococcales archaeon]|nr:hypothetical protein [Desulfurococcales archaeon]
MAWVNGRILILHLSGDSVEATTLNVPEKVFMKLGGGRGLAMYLYMHLVEDQPDPLSVSNPLIIAPGLLLGSKLTTASKTIIAARSPKTGFMGRSSVGARLGLELRRLGYDGLVVTGGMDEPSILVIDCDGVSVRSASGVWGK